MSTDHERDDHHISEESIKHAFLRNVGAVLTALAPICLALFVWGAGINERMREHDVKLSNLEKADERHERFAERDRGELLAKLDRVSNQIEELQKSLRAQHPTK